VLNFSVLWMADRGYRVSDSIRSSAGDGLETGGGSNQGHPRRRSEFWDDNNDWKFHAILSTLTFRVRDEAKGAEARR
jgi:hypothetical protein